MHPAAISCALEGIKHVMGVIVQDRNQQHSLLAAQLHADTVTDLVDAVTTKSLDIVEQKCQFILNMYAEQARHYMNEQKTYTKKIVKSTNVLERNRLLAQSNSIDDQLAEIRAAASESYKHMGSLLLAIAHGKTSTFTYDLSLPRNLSMLP